MRLKYPVGADKSRDWLMDADEMFAVRRGISGQSPVALYTQEPTVKPGPDDDFILIRPRYVQT